jgi:DNA-binding NarL/FixJ family response regulator
MNIRVLIVDDDPLLRAGLRLMLGAAADLEVVGEAGDGAAAITGAAELRPDVILMDIRMPGVDGVTATAQISAQPDPPRIIVLTTFDADELVHRAVGAGADGYLVKDTPPAEIVSAIRSVAVGLGVLSPSVTRPLLELVQRAAAARSESPMSSPAPAPAPAPAPDQLGALTDREREVAVAVARGASNAEIGAQLYLSTATVKAAVSRILTKLGLANRTQIAVIVRDAPSAHRGVEG